MRLIFVLLLLVVGSLRAQNLPGTQSLEPDLDRSATMVAGIDRFCLQRIEESKTSRQPTRERLKQILGVVDERLPIHQLELVGDMKNSALLEETELARIFRVRWPVLDGVHGEGILVQPKGEVVARVVYLPDADTPPEMLARDAMLAYSGCEIVIPALISRASDFSANARFGIKTNLPHREWIYRQSYIFGRHIIGFEVQKVLALVDYFEAQKQKTPLLVAGLGEGGLIAMNAGAMDPRIHSVYVWGYFSPREAVWAEPIYRNVFGLLRDFGDAETASLIAPRPLVIQNLGFPKVAGPPAANAGERAIAAPGKIGTPSAESVAAEVARAQKLVPGDWIKLCGEGDGAREVVGHLFPGQVAAKVLQNIEPLGHAQNGPRLPVDPNRQERMIRELEAFAQRLLVGAEIGREGSFWKPLPVKNLTEFQARTATERERFWKETIGRLPDPNLPINPRSRLVRETAELAIYEVTLDVWQDVFVWGWLCLPKNLQPGERRPVVVCQHGLEGLPEDTFNEDQKSRAWAPYHAFALRLAQEGFVTFAPNNLYRGGDAFRSLQRKLNPLGLTLYSVINGQHQRILEWLKAQPFTLPDKIAFYGLSYGGKSAMRTPSVLPGYCLSICSGDFNEWVRKCASPDLPMSYLHAGEYEIWEWNLAHTFSYAEMAALIAPRPFMVERGSNDGVGLDEWVDYEFAKVRRLYTKLQLSDRVAIEHFEGPHTIHGVGTFEFLHQHLNWPPVKR